MTTISTSKLSGIAGLGLPVKFLKDLGLEPVYDKYPHGTMWDVEDVDNILLEIGLHFINKSKIGVDQYAPYGYKKNGEPAKKRGRVSRLQILMKETK
jgi:hypothetical protein